MHLPKRQMCTGQLLTGTRVAIASTPLKSKPGERTKKYAITITIYRQHVFLQKVFEEIGQQTGVCFLYNVDSVIQTVKI